MPAIITHDLFGRDLLQANPSIVGGSLEERQAFLLGNQGPDPLFYLKIHPLMQNWLPVGDMMHKQQPSSLLVGLHRVVNEIGAGGGAARTRGADEAAAGGGVRADATGGAVDGPGDYDIALAYAKGFLGHFALDSQAHPLVYWYQYGICDAGEPGLDRTDGRSVHAVIESTLDETALFRKRRETVLTYPPHKKILDASDRVLAVVSGMYARILSEVYGLEAPDDLFRNGVLSFRVTQRAFYSPRNNPRAVVERIEKLLGRRHSFYSAMTHRVTRNQECLFDNHEHATWTNPSTGEASNLSFWDVYDHALEDALAWQALFVGDGFGIDEARSITRGRNFSGRLAERFVA